MTLFERRVIYADLYRRAMLAEFEANYRVPLIDASVDPSEVPDAMARHKAIYAALEKRRERPSLRRTGNSTMMKHTLIGSTVRET